MTTLAMPSEVVTIRASCRDPVGLAELKNALPAGAELRRVHVGGAIRSPRSIVRFLGSHARGAENRVSVDFETEKLFSHPGFQFAEEGAMLNVALLSPEQLELPGSPVHYGDMMLNGIASTRSKRWNLALCPAEAVVQLAVMLVGQKPGEHVCLVMKPLQSPVCPPGYGGIFDITTDENGRHVRAIKVTPGTSFSEHHRFVFLVPELRHGDASDVPGPQD